MKNTKRLVVFEFNGVPGCGKTTVSKEVIKKLKASNFIVSEPRNFFNGEKNLKKIMILLSIFKIENLKVLYYLFVFSLNIKPLEFARIKHIKLAYFYYYYIKRMQVKSYEYDFIVLDQGIIQAIVSILKNDKVTNYTKLYKLLDTIFEGIQCVYTVNCEVDSYIARNRIRGREPQKGGRLDYISDDDELLSTLSVENKYFKIIREHIINIDNNHHIQISMESTLSNNVEEVLRILYHC